MEVTAHGLAMTDAGTLGLRNRVGLEHRDMQWSRDEEDATLPFSLPSGTMAGISQFGIRASTAIPFQASFGELTSL